MASNGTVQEELPNIAGIVARLAALPQDEKALVERVLRIEELVGFQAVPQDLRAKVARWCGGSGDAASQAWRKAEQQTVVAVHGIWTFESANFNALRACRPLAKRVDESQTSPDGIAAACKGIGNCDFCDALRLTCVEPFGRVTGKFSLTCGNVFKSAGLHGLVIWHKHEPHQLTTEEVVDGFETADRWIEEAQRFGLGEHRPTSCEPTYPVMFWNCFGSAGASQVHPHMQLQLFGAPVGQGALLREQAVRYRRAMAAKQSAVTSTSTSSSNSSCSGASNSQGRGSSGRAGRHQGCCGRA